MLDKPKTRTRNTKPKSAPACKAPLEVYALQAWSVKKLGDNWYVSPTACFDNKPEWSKPYASLYRATTAIARKLAEEVLARQKRRTERYGNSQ
jgi:hypothetical protein